MYILLLISFLITLAAQINVQHAYRKYSQIQNSRNLTGAEAARQLLYAHGITDVRIEQIGGSLTDHYDPKDNVIRLSRDVYNTASVASVGVAMHEAGHAIQYAENYGPIVLRNAIVKSTNIASNISYLLILLGLLFSSYSLMTLGIWAFTAVIFFQLVTLPVEFNASGRAVKALKENDWLEPEEIYGVTAVLRAAALTYVAAVAVAVLQLFRLLAMRGDDD